MLHALTYLSACKFAALISHAYSQCLLVSCVQFQGRAVFRHDLAMPLAPLLATYCQWRGIELEQASFLWLQFYMRLHLTDAGVGRGMDDGDTIYIYDRKVRLRGTMWFIGITRLHDGSV